MDIIIPAIPVSIVMLVSILSCLEIGRRFGIRKLKKDPQALSVPTSVDGAPFALYGLLVDFTFSGAVARFDARRQLIAVEANTIGTAYLRLDLLPAESKLALRERMRLDVDSRLEYTRNPDRETAKVIRA